MDKQAEHVLPGPGKGKRASNVENLSPPEPGWGRRRSQVEEVECPQPGWGRRTSVRDGAVNDGSLKSTQHRVCEVFMH